ncbi:MULTISPECIES: thioredoxin family protein [unclassified Facklamia]|uniref:thioredoxin family protein n=1 Tax=Aerococcaceae TaxID=186827 RepID=UPI0013B8104A|nr:MULTISPECIES: thioredoxin family protein [unclassified Facklamia]NEW63894.1 thioredoxin [Facklamia sp. 252]NEW67365.1 thioredoxin [Facklamia sp. 253]QQD65241.1 thioredoxin family protein [Aerococcaceae bacterium zg-252]
MEKITQFDHLLTKIEQLEKVLIYVSMENCSVCTADKPRVETLVNDVKIPAFEIKANEIPEAAGQFQLFTAPVVLLFYQGKEWHRQARIIDFDVLDYRMKQLMEA